MKTKKFAFLGAVIMVFALNAGANAAQSELVNKYLDALDAQDANRIQSILAENKDKIVAEIKALLDEAMKPGTRKEDRESDFYIAELLATGIKESTGDFSQLKEVKKAVFNSKLTAAVRSNALNGVHAVVTSEVLEAPDKPRNFFLPDNIIIKKGETVRWKNTDPMAHVLVSMPVIGIGGIKATRIEPGQTFEFKFEAIGEYYYMCYIHKSMVGKVTVEE